MCGVQRSRHNMRFGRQKPRHQLCGTHVWDKPFRLQLPVHVRRWWKELASGWGDIPALWIVRVCRCTPVNPQTQVIIPATTPSDDDAEAMAFWEELPRTSLFGCMGNVGT